MYLAHVAKPLLTSLRAGTHPPLQSPAKAQFAAFDLVLGGIAGLGGGVISCGVRVMSICVRIIPESLCSNELVSPGSFPWVTESVCSVQY